MFLCTVKNGNIKLTHLFTLKAQQLFVITNEVSYSLVKKKNKKTEEHIQLS